jgi:hypothetical protein
MPFKFHLVFADGTSRGEKIQMRRQKGFSLIELLIVVHHPDHCSYRYS